MLWPRLRSLSALCPPLVRLVLLAFRASPLVRLVSALCPPLLRLVLLALAAPPVLVRFVSATCPPCVVGFGRASNPCPPLVRLVSCPPRLRSFSAMCPPCVVGFGRASTPCPPLFSALCCWLRPRLQSLSATCVRIVLLAATAPPVLVRHLSALCPPCVRHLSALCCWLWPLLQSLSATCVRIVLLAAAAPPVLVRHLSALCPPCVRHLSALCCWLWPRLQSLSATCPPCARLALLQSLYATCPAGVYLYCPPVNIVSGCCSPLNCLVSAIMSAVHPSVSAFLRRKKAGRDPCVRHCPPRVCFGRASKPCPPPVSASCVSRHVSALCLPRARSLPAQVHHVSSPLDFVRSWPAAGQGHGIK